MFVSHIALVSQSQHVSFSQLAIANAALQKQITRDFSPLWGLEADIAPFEKLSQVPLGYWPIIIMDNIHKNAQGIHLNKANGQPFALVQFSTNWALTTSHECLEMLADPSGNRTQAGDSVKPGQGRVEYLVEVCDPSEAAPFGYSVNGVLLSDFYTPRFFDPVVAPGVRYSFTGVIEGPRQVLDGGYLSWFDPESGHVFQLFVTDGDEEFVDLGEFPGGFGSLRAFADRNSFEHRMKAMTANPPAGLMLTAALGSGGGASATATSGVDASQEANAQTLQRQIDYLVKGS